VRGAPRACREGLGEGEGRVFGARGRTRFTYQCLVVLALTKDAKSGFLVFSIGLVVFAAGITLFTRAAVFYQARPVPRPPVREFVAWHPSLVVRAALVVVLAGLTAIGLAVPS
jgi:hypothetical protein